MEGCLFCDIYAKEKEKIIVENDLAFAIYDAFPVNEGHVLIMPKRHCINIFHATPQEISDIYELMHRCKTILDDKYSPTGYNIGANVGYDGGQTIFHLHVHIIPRYSGDVENPRGGIRRIKPQMVHYEG